MKKLSYALGALLALVVLAAFVAPRFIDWGAYKSEITRGLEAATGRRVTIGGDVSLTLLPSPKLRASDVRIANLAGGAAPEFARIGVLQMRLSLWSLLGGRLVATGVELQKPTISLELSKAGQPNWVLKGRTDSTNGALVSQNLGITDGVIRYRNLAVGQDLTFRRLALRIVGGEAGAPYALRGGFRLGRSRIAVRGTLTPRADRVHSIALNLGHVGSGSRFVYLGTVQLSTGGPRLAGRIEVSSDRLRQFLRATAAGAAPGKVERSWLPNKLSVQADLAAAGSEASFDALKVRLGEIVAGGRVDASLTRTARFLVSLKFNRLDLDKVLSRGGGKVPGLRIGQGDASRWPEVELDIKANALVFRREIIRDLRLLAKFRRDAGAPVKLTAQLPGAAQVRFDGTGRLATDGPKFNGRFDLSAGNLRGVLDWLGLDTSRVPAARLRRAVSKGEVRASSTGIEVKSATFDVDTSHLAGEGALFFGERPGVKLRLTIDQLDLEAYLPRQRPPAPRQGGTTAKKAPDVKPSAGKGKIAPLRWRGPFDVDFDIRVGQLAYAGETARDAHIDGSLTGGVVRLRQVSISDLAGVSGSLKGKVSGVETEPAVDLKFVGEARQITRALALIGVEIAPLVDRLGRARASGTLSGTRSNAKIDMRLKVAGGSARLSGELVPSLVAARYALKIEIDHPRAKEVVEKLGFERLAANGVIGAVRLSGTMSGDLATATIPDLSAAIADARINGALKIELARIRPRVTGQIETNDLTAAQLAALPAALVAAGAGSGKAWRWQDGWPKEPINLDGLKALDAELLVRPAGILVAGQKIEDPVVELAIRDGVLDLSRLTGRLFGGDLALRMKLVAAKQPELQAIMTLSRADLVQAAKLIPGLAVNSGLVDIDAELGGKGLSVDAMAADLNGTLSVTVHKGSVAGFDLARINRTIARQTDSISLINLLTEGMSTGATRFERMAGKMVIVDGVGTVSDGVLKADGGTATATGEVRFRERKMKARAEFRFAAIPKAPPLRVDVAGKLGDLSAVFRFNELQRHLLAGRRQRK